MSARIAVVGAGSWGTALAQTLSGAGCAVRLVGRDPEVVAALSLTRRHPWALPGVELRREVDVMDDLAAAVAGARIVVLAVPSQAMRSTAALCAAHVEDAIVVSAAKGFELGTGLRMTEVIADALGARRVDGVAALSGPNIALEVARGLPAATVVATSDPAVAVAVRDACTGPSLRFYSTDDVVGVEYAGALKNVVALAAGICDGMGAGDNGKAALVTRGMAEIARLGVRAGARALTFAGLAGIGDCLVTCTSPHSRNRGLGERIGRGIAPAAAVGEGHMVVEGIDATRVALLLARRHGVEMPIAEEIHAVLFENKDVAAALADLMTRGAADELRGLGVD
ncbi:MAG: NAD(P)H-dependent glycerol-3-phosphate dehydrogenase [Candidatus Dormibacteria bacterium]